MNDRISIVVPVYGVEKYLPKCLDSIMAQTYPALEVILVDDGSPDRCGEICEEYARKDSRFVVCHQKNMGLSGARNTGIGLATGEYIGFVDSDDYIDADMYETMLQVATHEKADIVVCGYRTFGARNEEHPGRDLCMTMPEAMGLLIENKMIPSFAWNKLYRRSYFDGVAFPVGKRYEDVRMMHRIFMQANRVCMVGRCLYHYCIREDSITGKTRDLQSSEYIESLEERCNDLKGTPFYEQARKAMFVCVRRVGYEIVRHGGANSRFFAELMDRERALYREIKPGMKGRDRIEAEVFVRSPRLYAMVRGAAEKMGV